MMKSQEVVISKVVLLLDHQFYEQMWVLQSLVDDIQIWGLAFI